MCKPFLLFKGIKRCQQLNLKDNAFKFTMLFNIQQFTNKILKEIRSLLRDNQVLIRISYVQDKIADNKPPAPTASIEEERTFDLKLILPKYKYIIDNMIFKDQQIYGKKFDGQDREYRILWKDKDGKEYFVPLEGLDKSEAKNPNGAFSYNSETKELIFSAIVASDAEYILRSYKY